MLCGWEGAGVQVARGGKQPHGGGGVCARRAGAQRGGGRAEESGGGRAKEEVGETARGAAAGRGARGGPEFRDEVLGLRWCGVVGEWGGQDLVMENRRGETRGHQERWFDNTGA